MIDPLSLLAIFGPLVVKTGESLLNKFVAPDVFKPTTVDDYIKMKELDIKHFEALNNAGGNNASYPWVEACVRLMRPGIAVAVIGTWAICQFTQTTCDPQVQNFAAAIGFYLFGDRTLFYASKK